MVDDELSPKERAEQALQEAVEIAREMDDAETPIEAGNIEDEAVKTLVDGVGRALVDGLNAPAGRYAGILCDEIEYYNKSNIKQDIKERTEELRNATDGKQRLDEWLQERLETVTINQTTDAKQGATFTWDFNSFKVETESGRHGRGHFEWSNFRDLIHESGGPNLGKPEKDRRSGDAWRDFVAQLIENRGETRRITGPRTQAVQQLSNKIKAKVGYGTPESALEYTGIWILCEEASVDLPEWWQVFGQKQSDDRDLSPDVAREVRIHDDIIADITDDVDITRMAFYTELDARNHTIPGSGGPSMTEYVDGSEERFWTLRPDIGTPRVYVPDPHADDAPAIEPTFTDSDEDTEPSPEPQTEPETDDSGFDSVGETA